MIRNSNKMAPQRCHFIFQLCILCWYMIKDYFPLWFQTKFISIGDHLKILHHIYQILKKHSRKYHLLIEQIVYHWHFYLRATPTVSYTRPSFYEWTPPQKIYQRLSNYIDRNFEYIDLPTNFAKVSAKTTNQSHTGPPLLTAQKKKAPSPEVNPNSGTWKKHL